MLNSIRENNNKNNKFKSEKKVKLHLKKGCHWFNMSPTSTILL